MTLFKSNNLAAVFVSDDGRILRLTFETDKGTKVDLEIPSIEMPPMIQKIMGVVSIAEARSNLSRQGVVAAMSPAQTGVGETDDGQDILISFRLNSGLEYKFALPAIDAVRFGHQIAEAGQKKNKSSKPTPH